MVWFSNHLNDGNAPNFPVGYIAPEKIVGKAPLHLIVAFRQIPPFAAALNPCGIYILGQ